MENMSAEQAFGERVRELRQVRGWSQSTLADKLAQRGHPVHQSTIAKLESGTRPTSVGEVAAIAEAFGVAPSALLDSEIDTDSQVLAALVEQMNKAWDTSQRFRETRDEILERLKTYAASAPHVVASRHYAAAYLRLKHDLLAEVSYHHGLGAFFQGLPKPTPAAVREYLGPLADVLPLDDEADANSGPYSVGDASVSWMHDPAVVLQALDFERESSDGQH